MRRLGKGRFRLFRGQRGFSLLEVLIAVGILGMIGVAFLNGLTTASNAVAVSQERVIAESLAKSQLEHIKAQDYISVEEYVSANCSYEEIDIPDDLVGKYEIEIIIDPDYIIAPAGGGFELQSITVVIRRNGEAIMRMSSYRCGSSA